MINYELRITKEWNFSLRMDPSLRWDDKTWSKEIINSNPGGGTWDVPRY